MAKSDVFRQYKKIIVIIFIIKSPLRIAKRFICLRRLVSRFSFESYHQFIIIDFDKNFD